MASTARSDIANAIWLCGNCHKLIDNDEARYPAGLLFEWVKQHENRIARQVGKTGALARQRYEDRYLEGFGKLSYRAERILIEKPDMWEYLLTEEVLRFEMASVTQRWQALKKKLYMKPMQLLSRSEFIGWIVERNTELLHLTAAFDALINEEFARAWGPLGQPGNENDIISTCRLFAEMCSSALTWEEAIRFTEVRGAFRNVLKLYVGIAGQLIDEATKLPVWMTETFSQEDVAGAQRCDLVLTIPEGWSEAVQKAYGEAEGDDD